MKILITAGPTREMLDPVRFISNLSTGEMGYSLALAAKKAGHEVTLVSGPAALVPPQGIRFVPVVSALDLKRACDQWFPRCDVLIMTAAVCDFTAKSFHRQKIRRTRIHRLTLKQTPDILAGLARKKGKRLVIGFCLETQNWLENAKAKIRRKNLDGIVANYYSKNHVPFGRTKINTALIGRDFRIERLTGISKKRLSQKLIKWIGRIGI